MKLNRIFLLVMFFSSINLFSQYQTIFPAYTQETEFTKDQDTWKEQYHEVIRLDPEGYPSEIFTYLRKEDGTYELYKKQSILSKRGAAGEIIEVENIIKDATGQEKNKETYTADYFGDNKWKVKEALFEEKTGSAWLPSTKNVFEHNDDGHVIKNTSFKYVAGNWVENYFWELFYKGIYLDYEIKRIWNNNQFQNNMKIDYSRDSQQNLSDVSYFNYDFNLDQWVEFWREKYYNSSDGYPEYIYRSSYNFISHSWGNYDRIILEKYSAESFTEIIRLIQKWDEGSQNYIDESLIIGSDSQSGANIIRNELDVNSAVRFIKSGSPGGGYLFEVGETEDKYYNYDEPEKSFVENKYFDIDNNLIEKVKSKMGTDLPISKISYEYQKEKGFTSRQETAYIYDEGEWLNDRRMMTVYDEQGNEIDITIFNYLNDDFVEFYRISKTYNGNNIIASEKYFYDETVKQLNEKLIYTYSEKGTLDKITKLTYKSLTGDYSEHSVQHFTYDTENNISQLIYNTFDQIRGIEQNNTLLKYSYTLVQNKSVPDTIWTLKWNGTDYSDYSIESYEYNNTTEVMIESGIISDYSLFQNYPNPFNPVTTIKYSIPDNEFVTLKVYDILGKEVNVLENEEKERGSYSVEFDASNLASGIYFYRLSCGNFAEVKKMALLK